MAFTNLFRRHSGSNEGQAANYVCMDENSTSETLLDELETQCRNSATLSSKKKRNSIVSETSGGLLASTYTSSTKRHASVDYSWLNPQNNLLQLTNDVYQLPDIVKMELSELIHNVSPEDCTHVVNQFRRHMRSQIKGTTPENIIALFRKTLADYIDQKPKNHCNSNKTIKPSEINTSPTKTINSLVRNNRVLPKYLSEDEQQTIAELAQISLTPPANDGSNSKPRSNTCT
jgi:hypothetical protein